MQNGQRPLEGKVVLVTGGAGDLGRSIIEVCSQRGATAIAADLATALELDVRSPESWASAVETVVQRSGRLDALVNAAGVVRDSLFEEVSEDDWEGTLDVNLKGALLGCQAAAPYLRRQSGRIVNISSASWLGNVGQAAYSASKGGLVSLTRTLALELGREGVLVNAIAPWFIEGRLTSGIPDKIRERAQRSSASVSRRRSPASSPSCSARIPRS